MCCIILTYSLFFSVFFSRTSLVLLSSIKFSVTYFSFFFLLFFFFWWGRALYWQSESLRVTVILFLPFCLCYYTIASSWGGWNLVFFEVHY